MNIKKISFKKSIIVFVVSFAFLLSFRIVLACSPDPMSNVPNDMFNFTCMSSEKCDAKIAQAPGSESRWSSDAMCPENQVCCKVQQYVFEGYCGQGKFINCSCAEDPDDNQVITKTAKCNNSFEHCYCDVVSSDSASASDSASTSTPPAKTFKLYNPLGTTSIPIILGRIINMLLGVIGSLALVAFIYGGGMYMLSRGDSGMAKKGRDAMINAVIGLFIILLSYIITNTIISSIATSAPIATPSVQKSPSEKPTKAKQDQTNLEKQQDASSNLPSGG